MTYTKNPCKYFCYINNTLVSLCLNYKLIPISLKVSYLQNYSRYFFILSYIIKGTGIASLRSKTFIIVVNCKYILLFCSLIIRFIVGSESTIAWT
jgi:hypothetical protein